MLHHGGKATATISVPGRTCNDNAATATKLAINNAVALSQAGHFDVEMVEPRSIARENTRAELIRGKCQVTQRLDVRLYRHQARGLQRWRQATAGTGSAVIDLIFSIAKREVTFFNGTLAISFL